MNAAAMNTMTPTNVHGEGDGVAGLLQDLPECVAERIEGVDLDTDVLLDLSGVRWDLVARVQDQIADGVYETEAKIDAALNRMVDEMRLHRVN